MENIKDLSATDRPREKMLLNGPLVLSDAELLAILLGSGTKEQPVLSLCAKLLSESLEGLAGQSIDDLCQIKGIGMAKGAIIVAAMELGRRRIQSKIPKIKTNEDAIRLVKPYFLNTTERLYILILLNRNYELLATCELRIALPEVSHLLQLVIEAGAFGFGIVRNAVKDTPDYLTAEANMLADLAAASGMLQLKYLGRILLE